MLTRLTSVGVAVLALLTVVDSPPALAQQDLMIIRPENYQGMPARFGSTAFDVGPYREIPSPDPSTFRSLHVPLHRNLVRIGHQDTYLVSNPWKQAEVDRDKGSRTAITARMGDESFLYVYLLLLQFGEAHLSEAALKQEKESRPGGPVEYYTHNYSYYPRFHVGVLAHALTNDASYLGYFCKRPGDCIPGNNRTPNGQMLDAVIPYLTGWGGDSLDPFRVREKYYAFIGKHVKTLVAWSKSLSKEAYIVGRTTLPQYDFARGGFPLQISFPKGSAAHPRLLHYHDSPTAAKFVHQPTYFDTLLRLPPAAAEALIEDLKANYGGKSQTTVLFTMKVRFTNIGAMENNMLGLKALYELTEPRITLFKDESLQQEIAAVPL